MLVITCWGAKRRSGDDSTHWRSSSSSSRERETEEGGPKPIQASVLSAAEAGSENPGAAFPFRETLKGRLLGNSFGFDAKLCGFVSNWASVMGLLAGVHLREGELIHTHTQTPGWAIYLIRCSNERNVVYPPLKRRLVWLWCWKRPRRRGEGRRPGRTGKRYKSRAHWGHMALTEVHTHTHTYTHTHTHTHSCSIMMACPINSAVGEVSLAL